MSAQERSRLMSKVTGKDTGPEKKLRSALWELGYRYSVHYDVPGEPDMAFIGPSVAVFVDGCFWHYCPEHGEIPDTNQQFWTDKFERNRERDHEVNKELQSRGWQVIRIWEHTVENDLAAAVKRVATAVEDRSS